MTIYIKPYKKTSVYKKNQIIIRDIAEVVAPEYMKTSIEEIKLMDIQDINKKKYIISIIDIIKAIHKKYPDVDVESVGEENSIIEYAPKENQENGIFTFMKVLCVSCILFAGGGIAIMTFHTDAALPDVLKELYEMFTGIKTDKPYWIQVPYSIGIAVGIIVFFNHFSSKKITDDPTPIEVEMDTYEDSVEDCIIDAIIEEKRRNQ